MFENSLLRQPTSPHDPLLQEFVRAPESRLTCFYLKRSQQTSHLLVNKTRVRKKLSALVLTGLTRESHQLSEQIACGTTGDSEAREKT